MAIIKLPIVFYAKKVRISFQYASFLVFQGRRKKPKKSEKKNQMCYSCLIFYFQATVSHNCRSQEKAYLAGRSNYFFMILLLGTFLLCLAAVAYGITQYSTLLSFHFVFAIACFLVHLRAKTL